MSKTYIFEKVLDIYGGLCGWGTLYSELPFL